MLRFYTACARILASRKFFVVVVALLVFQALWIAFSFHYPMLWDEYYHFGLIQFYSHHLNPIITHQPPSLDLYGNVVDSPKYLYHWLMSFPYRLIVLFTKNQVAQIVSLRIINIAMFAGGLVAFRQAMLRMTRNRALVHFTLFALVLLPLSSLLAATINYDNFEFLMAGLVLLWTLEFIQADHFRSGKFLLVLGGGLVASVAKYTFLPILLAILIIMTWRIWHRDGNGAWAAARASFMGLSKWAMIGLTLLVLASGALALQRFGGNVVKYHSIDPDCAKVLNTNRCLSFSPYKFNYNAANVWNIPAQTHFRSPLVYTVHDWLPQLYEQYFITGTQLAPDTFAGSAPRSIPIPFFTVLGATAIGLVCFALDWRKRIRQPEVWLAVAATVILAGALWVEDFAQYHYTGWPVAIQGRYLVPMLPFIMLLGVMSVSHVIASRRIKGVLAALLILGLLWGGGLTTHIVGSKPTWLWQNNTVQRVNGDLKRVLKPLVF